MTHFADETAVMRRALELAAQGVGRVEPNPAVGAVVVDAQLQLLGEGYHQKCGGPHAEVHALQAAGTRARGAVLFVTLEPCCHHGKTPPCSRAVIDAGISRVVLAVRDPAPHVDGGGIRDLEQAGMTVECGLLQEPAALLIAPFLKRVTTGRPYVHAKWAMTLDGKLATRTGASQWLSNEVSRSRVHTLRGRMDAIIVGSRTARLDDPLLTARPPGPRTATRIVVDRELDIPLDCRLLQTVDEAPVLLATSTTAAEARGEEYGRLGAEVIPLPVRPDRPSELDLDPLLAELGRREMTNVLVEGGGGLLGSLFDAGAIDEVHVFLAPKLLGGRDAVTPLAGLGLEQVPSDSQFVSRSVELLDSDVYTRGMLDTPWWRAVQDRL